MTLRERIEQFYAEVEELAAMYDSGQDVRNDAEYMHGMADAHRNVASKLREILDAAYPRHNNGGAIRHNSEFAYDD